MHVPVMLHEAILGLNVLPGADVIDCTVGQGGHARAILQASGPTGRLLGLDRDADAIELAGNELQEFGSRVTLVQSSFADVGAVARDRGFGAVSGILFDLGFSSNQLELGGRGFSFQRDEPLDMRFDGTGPRAADLVNDMSERELADLLFRYGEESSARTFARAIVAARPISTSGQLAGVIEAAAGGRGKIHPATRTFQALRIAVNDELGAISSALPQAVSLLKPGGRLVIITFHSLEDRLVKDFIRQESVDCICPPRLPECRCGHKAGLRQVTAKPVTPSAPELGLNPRARSAKLRIAEAIGKTQATAHAIRPGYSGE